VLDTDNVGYITVPKMRELLTTRGVTPFREKEVDGECVGKKSPPPSCRFGASLPLVSIVLASV
jgi:hypothetical protein